MVDLESSDLNRMVLAIEHECKTEIDKINKESRENYETIKNRKFKEIKDALDKKYKNELDKIEKNKAVDESRIKTQYKIKFDIAKSLKLKLIIQQVSQKLKNTKLSKRLYTQTTSKIGLTTEDHPNWVVFCTQNDLPNIKKHFFGTIKIMPENGLGGIVFSTKDGKIICDNTYHSRLHQFLLHNTKHFKKDILE